MIHLIVFGRLYQALNTTFQADDGHLPLEGEVFVCSLLMAYSSGASVDTNGLKSWSSRVFIDILGSCSLETVTGGGWKPSKKFCDGKYGQHDYVKEAKE